MKHQNPDCNYVEIGEWNCPKCFDFTTYKGFPICRFLPKGYKGSYNKITKGKFKDYFRLFDYGNK